MLLILMYHRVHGVGRVPDALGTHLRYLCDHHPLVLPGDALTHGSINVCLTFDDATVDFRHQVFPLLETLAGRALVAVPTGWIKATTRDDLDSRLAAQRAGVAMRGRYAAVTGSPLCTWRELHEMQSSGRVLCASHGHDHADMSAPETDVDKELELSFRALRQHLRQTPTTFVYPYGRTRPDIQAQVGRRFRYAMRIGSAINLDWSGNEGLLYRVNAEHFWPHGKVWSFTDRVGWQLKYLANRLRGK
jgi:peptidoglycan/xylan/chitin deacetylase (PgdA/CDA1 family)